MRNFSHPKCKVLLGYGLLIFSPLCLANHSMFSICLPNHHFCCCSWQLWFLDESQQLSSAFPVVLFPQIGHLTISFSVKIYTNLYQIDAHQGIVEGRKRQGKRKKEGFQCGQSFPCNEPITNINISTLFETVQKKLGGHSLSLLN